MSDKQKNGNMAIEPISPEIEESQGEEKDLVEVEKVEEEQDAELIADLQDMPPAVRRQVQAFSAMFRSQMGPSHNPLFSKFTDEHINKYLDYLQRDDDNAHDLRKSNRWFYLTYFASALVVLAIAIVYLLPRDKEFLESVLQILTILAGGIGAGYGLKSRKEE
jgi:hypothetical protein